MSALVRAADGGRIREKAGNGVSCAPSRENIGIHL
jgi:hypothetical protein